MAIGLVQTFHTISPGAWGHERAWLYIATTTASVALGMAVIAYSLWLVRASAKEALLRVTDAFLPPATKSTGQKLGDR